MPERPAGLDVAGLAAARIAAGRTRARWLTRLAAGQVGLLDVVWAATSPGGRPLRGLRLKELLRTQPGWGLRRAEKAVARLRRASQVPDTVPDHRLTVAWMLDNRAAPGRRLAHLLEAVAAAETRSAPWPGFPYTARPGS